MKDFKTLTDKELLDLTDAKINKGGIPFKAVQEVQKRGLRKYINRTINSNDF
jgi:hypothetical protein